MTVPSSSDTPPLDRATLELARADIGFSAAHFSVLDGRAERLHGHNYRVILRVEGQVGSDGTVIDFSALKSALRAECAELDECVLLPTSGDAVRVTPQGDSVEVDEGDRHFVFPVTDVRLLPVPNTTCEWLAAWLLAQLRARLGKRTVRLTLTVEELPGQGATVKEL
ncbi:MAG: 6-carboxytetrahydropterin synthase [Candidatus Dormibacteraeota bacterium]|nr:6-carboxytetrahydropterin synthase [Candidatus Dormibacteraeota bacterium]